MENLKIIIGSNSITEELTYFDIETLAFYADKVTADSDIVGNIHASSASQDDVTKLTTRFPNLHISIG